MVLQAFNQHTYLIYKVCVLYNSTTDTQATKTNYHIHDEEDKACVSTTSTVGSLYVDTSIGAGVGLVVAVDDDRDTAALSLCITPQAVCTTC